MKTVPERSKAVQVLVIIAGFVAGPIAALQLSPVLSPGSSLVAAMAPASFALAFFFGLILWLGLGVVTVVGGILFGAAQGKDPRSVRLPTDRLVPAGHFVFIVTEGLAGAAVGLLGVVTSDASFVVAFGGWLTLGVAYGVALSSASSRGYLPFPDDD